MLDMMADTVGSTYYLKLIKWVNTSVSSHLLMNHLLSLAMLSNHAVKVLSWFEDAV